MLLFLFGPVSNSGIELGFANKVPDFNIRFVNDLDP